MMFPLKATIGFENHGPNLLKSSLERVAMNSFNIKKMIRLVLQVSLIPCTFSPFAASLVYSSSDIIITGPKNMAAATSTRLWIMNYESQKTYTWQLSGEGFLNPQNGRMVVYSAPAYVEDCEETPVITVADREGGFGSYEIGVYPPDTGPVQYVLKARGCQASDTGCETNPVLVEECCWELVGYNCDGSIWYEPSTNGGCCRNTLQEWSNCDDGCESAREFYESHYPYYYRDDCCPVISPDPPPDDLPQDCKTPGWVGDPISIFDGRKVESEEDLKFPTPHRKGVIFERHYDSRSAGKRALGYGWSHTYETELILNVKYHGHDYVKIVDQRGNGFYFLAGPDGRWNGTYKNTTFIVEESGGYVWHRLDGSRYGFSVQGLLGWIEDEIGNRQVIGRDDIGHLVMVMDAASGKELTFHYDSNNLMTHISGPVTGAVSDGVWVRYGYDSEDNLISVTYADGSGLTYGYADPNDSHNLTEKRDKQDRVIAIWEYDAFDRAVINTTHDGRDVSISYLNDQEVEVTDAYGVTRRYVISAHEGMRRVSEVKGTAGCPECSGGPTRYSYDQMLRVIEEEDANGVVHRYGNYDARGNAGVEIQAFGTSEEKTVYYTYHPEMNRKLSQMQPSVIGQGYKQTIWDYDDDYNDLPNENPTRLLCRMIQRGFTRDMAGAVIPYEFITAYQYNVKGQLVSEDGPLSGSQDTITYEYDSATGDLLSVTRPIIGTIAYGDYDAGGNVETITDENGVQTFFTYDGRNRRISAAVNGMVNSRTYDPAGEVSTIKDGAGGSRYFSYNATHGFLERITDAQGNSLVYDYDTQGNRIEEASYDSPGNRLRYMRFNYQDPQNPGKLWKEIYPDGTETEYEYDEVGSLVSVTDALNRITSYEYDFLKRLRQVRQPDSVVTQYAYDKQDNMTRITDAGNHVTQYLYDDAGRLLQIHSPDTGRTSYTYDETGNPVSKTDVKDVTVHYDYDAMSRLTAIHYPDSSQDVYYHYDQGSYGKGFLTGMTDQVGTASYSHDAHGNLVEESKTIDGITYITGYSYDGAGNLVGLTYPTGRNIAYNRDSSGQIISMTSEKDGNIKSLAFDIRHLPFGPITEITFGNNIPLTRSFDLLYRISHISAENVLNRDYVLDAMGHITDIFDNLDMTRDQKFVYDNLYRLSGVQGDYGNMSHTYDKVGNRLTETINGQTDVYSYESENNRIHEIEGTDTRLFSHDGNGNMITMGPVTLICNQNNRLIRAAGEDGTLAEYMYNGHGQRVKKISGGSTAVYHYDVFGNMIGESTSSGDFLSEVVYLNHTRLAVFMTKAVDTSIQVFTSKGEKLPDVPVYAFTGGGKYAGKKAMTDEQGVARFLLSDFEAGEYKFRTDYLGYHFWSESVVIPGIYSAEIEVPVEAAVVLVKQEDRPVLGVKVYLFNASGSYVGMFETTEEEGIVFFNLPVDKAFKFRADVLKNQFYSDVVTVVAEGPNEFEIDTGGISFTLTLWQGENDPLIHVKTYLFNDSGSYLGQSSPTNEQGEVIYSVPDGTYMVRVDYLGSQFWSDPFTTPTTVQSTLTIPHLDVTVTVLSDYNNDIQKKEGVKVYLFSGSGPYLGISGNTDREGIARFRIPSGTYKFRADYQGNHYWVTKSINADQINTVDLDVGGGPFTFTGEMAPGVPIVDAPVYVFNSQGRYMGIKERTNELGQVLFDLSDGEYKFRIDYLGYKFWSSTFEVPASLSDIMMIPHRDVSLKVNSAYISETNPLDKVRVYLFNSSGSYMGIYRDTDKTGEVIFTLPEKGYRARVDYLSSKYWCETFGWQDVSVNIDHGVADVHVTLDSNQINNAKVYLFNDSGSYLGRYKITDLAGNAIFLIPSKDYKFRVDHEGKRYWSEIISIISHRENRVDLPLEHLELNLTQYPNPVRFDEAYSELPQEKIVLASIGSLQGLLSNGLITSVPEKKLYYYINDHLGTPLKMIDENGDTLWSADYQPFGKAQIDSDSTIVNNFRFPGQYYDHETGLHYNYHRYYDPRTGRYLTPDPSHSVHPEGTSIPYVLPYIFNIPQELNRYSYVQNDPMGRVDKRGLLGTGFGGYGGGGGELSYNIVKCCENGSEYNVKVLTICGGIGVGITGKMLFGSSASFGGISPGKSCPQTRYYFKHENSFGFRSIGIEVGRRGVTAGVDFGIKGVASIWVFCSDTVLSKKPTEKCCMN